MFSGHALRSSAARRLIMGLWAALLGGLLIGGTASSVRADDAGVCTTTVEQLQGQGRFEMGGLSRFSFTGLEGSGNDLNDSGLDPAVIRQVLGNRITANWMAEMMPLLASGVDLGAKEVAILVVDDFPDRKLVFNTFSELPQKWRKQFTDKNITPTFPLEMPIITHGRQVFLLMRDLADRLTALYPSLKISLHRVDISVAGNYQLDLVAPAIQAKVDALRLQGIDRFVINMSFGLIPCTDPATGFDFSAFAAQRLLLQERKSLNELVNNFAFDLDGRNFTETPNLDGTVNTTVESRPVVYQDYGLLQYLTNDFNRAQADGASSAVDLLKGLLTSPDVAPDSDEPAMLALRNLLAGYMDESASGGAQFIAVGASGNYADLVSPDAPLAPASLPQVIAAGATLGERGNRWQFSQAAHLLAPGAWYDYSGRQAYVAGTSFAAPYVSMIGAVYLTYPDSCIFDGTHPPLLRLTYDNVPLRSYHAGFNCQPQYDADDPVELLTNRSFETPDIKGIHADRWSFTNLVNDQRVNNKLNKPPVAHTGKSAFQFNGTPNTTSTIAQAADIAPGFGAGDQLQLGFMVDANKLSAGAGKVRVVIKYSDGTPARQVEVGIGKGTYAYKSRTKLIPLASPAVSSLRVQVRIINGSGRFRVDDMSLMKLPAASLPSSGSELRGTE